MRFLKEAHLIDRGDPAIAMDSADLSGANLSDIKNLAGVNLAGANLTNTNLVGVNLIRANLNLADLSGTDLSQADLSYTYLKGAIGITTEQLEKQAKSLKGATMPDGSQHP